MQELRANNPVAFGDASESMRQLARWPACHTRTLPSDRAVTDAHARWQAWLQRQHQQRPRTGVADLAVHHMIPMLPLLRQRSDQRIVVCAHACAQRRRL
jgi:hypothetical protein